MSDFGTFKFTDFGINLNLKAQLGKELQFTKFVLGDGYYTGNIRDLLAVVNFVRNEDITRLNITNTTDPDTGTLKKKVQIGFSLQSMDVQTGFYLREIGLYAKDPDTNVEALALYANAGDTADYITPRR